MGPAGVCAMPSPRRPTRAISSRSTTLAPALGPEQEFAIAVAPENGGCREALDIPAQRRGRVGDLLADAGVNRRIADDALLDTGAAGFELRLDQCDEPR